MTDVNLAPDWAQHFHDDNSNFAVGWKLYTYMSRTETYKPAYSDPAGTILHNPVITLNSRGEVPGMGLYLISGEAYTLELRDLLGVVKKTVHNVIGGGTSGSSSSTPLPSQSVLGNITAGTTIGYPVKIESDLQTSSSDSNIPNVGAVLNELNDYLPNSGNNIYDGNLEVTGNLEASSITINGIEIGLEGPEGPPGEDGVDGTDGVDGVSLVSIQVDETSNTGKILYNLSNDPENWIDAGDIMPDGLGKVKNSESDSLDFLPEKIVAGEGISVSLDETNRLEISAVSMDDHKVQVHQYSTEANYAGTVLQAGAGIDISLTPDLNRLVIKATGTAVGGFYWKGAWDELTAYNSNNAVWYFDNTVTPVVNRLYIAMEPNQGIDPIEDTSGIWSEMMRVDTLGDMFVAVDEDDVQTGYLIDKIRNGSGIVVTRHTDIGGDAYLAINSTCLYSVTVGGVTKHSTELAGNISFSAGGGSVIAWDGNKVKISSVALGETSTTAYQGARGKVAYDHSQTSGNPHGTDFSELENKPTTLAGYGITDAMSTENGTITTQNWDSLTSHGVYRVTDWSGANGPVVNGVSAHKWGLLVVERYQETITQIYYPHYNDMPFTRTSSRGWGWGSWRTSPSDRVSLTDASGSSTLPIGDITQPLAIQGLRDNVKHLLTNATPKNHASTTTEYGEGSLTNYGHVKKAQYMTIDGNDVVPSSLMYQNVVQRFHMAAGGAGTAGWLKVCSLTCVGGYTNEPITIALSRRGADKTCQLTMRFQSTNNLTPYVELANYEGQDYGVYYHKRVEGTYDIYVQKAEPYDRCHITEFKSPYNIQLNSENGTVTAVPSGSIAFKRAPSDYSITGRLTSEDWNTFTEVGIYNVAGWSGANGPTINGVQAYKWGFLVVESYQGTVIQTYYPHRAGMPCYRQSWEGGAFIGWSTSPRTGAGLAPSTSFVYQSVTAPRTDNNAIYLCY